MGLLELFTRHIAAHCCAARLNGSQACQLAHVTQVLALGGVSPIPCRAGVSLPETRLARRTAQIAGFDPSVKSTRCCAGVHRQLLPLGTAGLGEDAVMPPVWGPHTSGSQHLSSAAMRLASSAASSLSEASPSRPPPAASASTPCSQPRLVCSCRKCCSSCGDKAEGLGHVCTTCGVNQ